MIKFESPTVSTKLCLSRSPSACEFHGVTWTHRLCVRGKKLQRCTESYLQPQQPPLRTVSHGFEERRRTSEREVKCICMRRRRAISVTSSYAKTEFRLGTLHIHTCMQLLENGKGKHALIRVLDYDREAAKQVQRQFQRYKVLTC